MTEPTSTPQADPSSGAPPLSAPGPIERDVHVLDKLAVLYRYRKIVLTVFALVVIAMMVQTFTTTPVYRAQARLLIDVERSGVAGFADGNAGQPDGNPMLFYQTQYRVLRGRGLAQRVVDALGLGGLQEFRPAESNGGFDAAWQAARTHVLAAFAEWSGDRQDREDPRPDETPRQSAVIDKFLDRVEIEPVRNSRLVDVYFQSKDPTLAARGANTLADEYVDQNLDMKLAENQETLDWLAAELERQQDKVEASERGLAEYRESQNALSLDERQNIVVSRLNQLNDAVTRAKTERVQKETIYNQVKTLAGRDRSAIPVVLQNSFIQAQKTQLAEMEREKARLSERYGDKHPEIVKLNVAIENTQRRIDEETTKSVDALRRDYESALSEERTLLGALQEQQGEAMTLDRKSVNYTVLEREAQTNRQVYEALLQREKELRVVTNSRSNNVQVIDRAEVPEKPFAPQPRRAFFISLVLGLALGIATAFGLDYLDDTVKTPEDVTRKLGLPFLGLVPSIAGGAHPVLSSAVPHDFGEAFRALRTSLVFSSGTSAKRVIAVTSSQPLEGKTTTACNLALALSFSGSRVLLIDADMRRPSLHRILDVPNEVGLSHLLVAQARAREAIQRTKSPNLWVLTAGRMPPNPSELLASERMKSLLGNLGTGPFDWVIIDTPPVLAVTDAVILMPQVSGVAFVLGAEMTQRRLVERAVATLMSSTPHFLGVVLNRVDINRNKYYYSRFYGYQYKSYYGRAAASA